MQHVLEKHTDPQTKEVTYTKCVLSKAQGKLPQVEISSKLLKKLKAHQVEGTQFYLFVCFLAIISWIVLAFKGALTGLLT